MIKNYILIDFENVQPETFDPPDGSLYKVFVFLGEKQTKLPVDLAASLQPLGEAVEYIRISGTGKNALDFHIAYWLGKLTENNPKSQFYIVSKDKGFDPLVNHLKKIKIRVQRVSHISDINTQGSISSKNQSNRFSAIKDLLDTNPKSRPSTRSKLENFITNRFKNEKLKKSETAEIINHLQERGYLDFSNQQISYN